MFGGTKLTASSCPRCGAEFPPETSPAGLCPACLLTTALSADHDTTERVQDGVTTLPSGTEVGPFLILSLLGRGGMSAVYEAHDTRLERTIALKVLPQEFLHDGSFASRFAQEARVVARLEHPGIVPIYASGIDNGIPWMSMRLFAGGNLGARLEMGRPEPRDGVRMLRRIADALDYAHARGVVHRDIKPTNILLDGSDGIYIGDFGLAQMLEGDRRATQTGTLVGTPHYIAPERALGEPTDHRCDIYSLGIIAYEIFVGRLPFTADSPVGVLLKHVNEPLPAPPDGLLTRALGDALDKALAKDPAKRWPSAGAFVAALEVALGMTPAAVETVDRERSTHRGVHWRLRWAGPAFAGLSAAIGLTWWIARGSTSYPDVVPPSVIDRSSEPASSIVSAAPSNQERINAPSDIVARAAVASASQETTAAPQADQQSMPLPTTAAAPSVASSVIELPPSPASPRPPSVSTVDVPTSLDRTPVAAAVPSVAGDIVVTPPVRLRTFTAEYPTAARAAQLEGDVLLQAVVGSDGKVHDVSVLRSVHPLLDAAAKKAVLRYEYKPGLRDGIPESVAVRLTVSFRLR